MPHIHPAPTLALSVGTEIQNLHSAHPWTYPTHQLPPHQSAVFTQLTGQTGKYRRDIHGKWPMTIDCSQDDYKVYSLFCLFQNSTTDYFSTIHAQKNIGPQFDSPIKFGDPMRLHSLHSEINGPGNRHRKLSVFVGLNKLPMSQQNNYIIYIYPRSSHVLL